jgi:splicing factor 45
VDESGLPVSKPTPFILPYSVSISSKRGGGGGRHNRLSSYLSVDPDWQFENEYDPMFPNDYDKALKELRDRRDREAEEEEAKRKVEVESEDKEDPEGSSSLSSMLAVSQSFSSSSSRDKGVAIAPPPSLNIGYDDDAPQAFSSSPQGGFGGRKGFGGGGGGGFGGFMAKYGYQEGEGLGRLGQGMSKALQVSPFYLLRSALNIKNG